MANVTAAADQEQERQRLAELYRGMSDEELELTAQDSSKLTDDAWQILQSELNRRQMNIDVDGHTPDAVPAWQDLVIVKQFRDLP